MTEQPIRGRCALCRCAARARVYGIKVCRYHVDHGENDRPCPYCHTYAMFDPRWTYTVNGQPKPRSVEIRKIDMPNTIFLDNNGEVVLDVVWVKEPAPRGWPTKIRPSVVMIGVGLQMGTTFTILQWASDRERELLDAARPVLALANRVFVVNIQHVRALAGINRSARGHKAQPTWPTLDVRAKTHDIHSLLNQQGIEPNERPPKDIEPEDAPRAWMRNERLSNQFNRESVWRHNYFNVLDTSMRVFQIIWPPGRREGRT